MGMSAWEGSLPRGEVSAQGSVHPLPMNRMADRCKNITLPLTSFVGGKMLFYLKMIYNKG